MMFAGIVTSRRNGLRAAFLFVMGWCASSAWSTSAVAQTSATWQGLVDGNWSNASNWTGSVLPTSGNATVLTFGGVGGTGYTATNDLSPNPLLLKDLLLNSGSTVANVLSGNSLQFMNGPRILQQGSGEFILNNVIIMGARNQTLGGDGLGLVTINGEISGGGTRNLNKSGASTFLITTKTAYNGTLNVNAGTLRYGVDDLIRVTNTISVNGAGSTLDLQGFAQTIAGFDLDGGAVLGSGGVGQLNLTGPFTTTGGHIGVSLGGGGQLMKSGPGLLALTGRDSTLSGAVRLGKGEIQVLNRASLGSGVVWLGGETLGAQVKLVVGGPQGTLVAASDFGNSNGAVRLLYGSTLRFDNYDAFAGGLANGRWGDFDALELFGARLELGGYSFSSLTEKVGAFSYYDGASVEIRRDTPGQLTKLASDSLQAGSAFATLTIFGTAGRLGQDERWVINAAPNLGLGGIASGIINGTDVQFVTYDGTSDGDGVIGLKNVGFTSASLASAGAADVVTAAATTLESDVGVLALRATGSLTNFTNQRLVTIEGGRFLNNVSVDTAHDVDFRFGASADQAAYVYAGNLGDIVLRGTLNTSGDLVKSGTGTVAVAADNSASFTGRTFINEGTLRVEQIAGLGIAPVVHLGGGTLDLRIDGLGSNGTIAFGYDVVLGQSGGSTINVDRLRSAHANNQVTLGNLQFSSPQSELNVTGRNGYTAAFIGANDIVLLGPQLIGGSGNLRLAPSGAGKITGAGGIEKQGSGRVTIGVGAHDFAGGVVVSGGAYRTLSNTGFGVSGNTVEVKSGASIELDWGAGATIAGRNLTLSGGTLRNTSGDNTWSGTVALSAASTFAVDVGTLRIGTGSGQAVNGSGALTLTGSSNGTVAGNLANASALTKSGTGTWTLLGTNNAANSAVTINAGILNIRAATSLGVNNSNALATITIAAGATLELQLPTTGTPSIGLSGNAAVRPLVVTGAGAGGIGAIHNLTGNNTLFGNITIGAATLIVSDGGTLTLGQATSAITLAANTLTLGGTASGVVNAPITAAAGGLIKMGSGTWTLNNANAYSGATRVTAGTLVVAAQGAIGSGSVMIGGTFGTTALLSASGAQGTFVVSGDDSTSAVNSNSSHSFGAGAVLRFDNSTPFAGTSAAGRWSDAVPITLASAVVELRGNAAAAAAERVGVVTFHAWSGINVVRAAATRATVLEINGGDPTNVAAALVRGSATRGVLSIGGTVGQLGGDEIVRIVNGAAPSIANGMVAPYLLNASENRFLNYVSAAIGFQNAHFTSTDLTSSTPADLVDQAAPLDLTTDAFAYALRTSASIGGGTNITIGSGGLITDTAPNPTYTSNFMFGPDAEAIVYTPGSGTVTIQGAVSTTAGLTKFGSGTLTLAVDNSATLSGGLFVHGGTLRYGVAGAFGAAGQTVYVSNGTLDFQSFSYSAATVTLQNGSVFGSGTLTATTAGAASFALDGGTINVGLSGATNVGLTKNTAATLTLNGPLSYGATTINGGVLRFNSGLSGTTGTINVASGAAVEIAGGITISRPLVSSGTGVGGTGVLRSVGGDNVWAGTINSSGGSLIVVDSGTLLVSGNITGAASGGITLGGAGTGTLSGTFTANGGQALFKTGVGRWILTNTNGRTTGGANVNAGTLTVRHSAGLGNNGVGNTGNTIVANGATLELENNITIGNATDPATRPLTLNGTGVDGAGALRNTAGGNAWLGNITIGAAGSSISVDAGTLSLGTSSSMLSLTTRSLVLSAAANTTGSLAAGIVGTTGKLTKFGAGTWILVGAGNRTDGDTFVAEGVLRLSHSAAVGENSSLGTGETFVAAGAALELNGGITVGSVGEHFVRPLFLRGAGMAGSALRNFSGDNVWLGEIVLDDDATISVDAGTLTLGQSLGVLSLGIHTLTLDGFAPGIIAADLAGSPGRLIKNGVGSWTLAGLSNHIGGTVINAGTLVGNTSNLQGFIQNDAALVFQQTPNGVFGGLITGVGSFTKQGAGALTFVRQNTYSGPTHVAAGALVVAAGGGITNVAGITIDAGARLDVVGNVSGNGPVQNSGTVNVGGSLGGGSTSVTVYDGGALTGVGGTIFGGATIQSGGAIAPGQGGPPLANGVGALVVDGATLTLAAGAHIYFDFLNATGDTPGTDWDFITVVGAALQVNASAAAPIALHVFKDPGSIDFNADAGTYSWLFMKAEGVSLLGGGDSLAARFAIDAGGVFGSGSQSGFNFAPNNFWVSQVDGDLYLNYSSVPEPSSLLLSLLGGAAGYWYWRRKSSAAADANPPAAVRVALGLIPNFLKGSRS